MKRIIGLFCILGLLIASNLFADEKTHHHVLILHSYHSTFPWTRSINQALIKKLDEYKNELHVTVEYMDTKYFPLSAVEDNLTESYTIKYANEKPDILIVSDNNALMFALGRRTTLFKDVPIIFSGINNFSPDMLGGEKNITGVAEGVDIAGCLDFVSRLQPDVTELIAIADNTITGQMNLKKFQKEMGRFSTRFETRELIGLTDEEIIPILKGLPSSSAIFYLSFFQDRFGKVRSMKENIEILAKNAPVPMYILWDWALPFGATGGVVTSGRMQGIHAGDMALKYLGGIPMSEIPIREKSPTEVLLNYPKALQYKLNFKLLPEQAVFFDPPTSFYYDHTMVVHITIGVIVFLLGGIITLIAMMKRERHMSSVLEQQKRLLNNILTNIPHYIFWKDQNFVYQGANNSFTQLAGFSSPDEIIGKHDEELASNEDHLNFYRKCDQQVIETGSPILNIEEPFVRADGVSATILISKVPLTDEKGKVTGLLGVALDITERIGLEGQLRQAQKMESVGRLAGGVAHDFNNMLSIIIGHTEMILEDLDSENPIIESLNEIFEAAERSSNLTRQLLAFARKQTVIPKSLDLNETIDGMLSMLRRLLGENIDLAWLPKPNLWTIRIDPSQIDQILVNLCVNARDAINDIGKLTIETDNVNFDDDYCREHDDVKAGDYVMTVVSDNGCGMNKDILDKLFEPFFTTKDIGEGTGLGLATVYGIVKQNQGFINVYSEPGIGTTFRIYFPRHIGENLPAQNLESKNNNLTGSETILLVEDEKSILTMTAMMLERLGYTVIKVSDPEEAVNIAKSQSRKINLLMTDDVMPDMNGHDLSEKIAQQFPDLKCLFMSGYTANIIARHGVLDSGVQFIQKPFSRQELAEKVRKVLDKDN